MQYLPDWTDRNYHSGHLAETERLAAERLLAETKDLIANAKYKTRQDEQEVDTRLVTYKHIWTYWNPLLRIYEYLAFQPCRYLFMTQVQAACWWHSVLEVWARGEAGWLEGVHRRSRKSTHKSWTCSLGHLRATGHCGKVYGSQTTETGNWVGKLPFVKFVPRSLTKTIMFA